MVGELLTPVRVSAAELTSCEISRSSRVLEWITGRTFKITPVLRYCTVCVTAPGAAPAPPLCWLVMMGTSEPTVMVADSPLRATTLGLDSKRALLELDKALKRARSTPARSANAKANPEPRLTPKLPKVPACTEPPPRWICCESHSTPNTSLPVSRTSATMTSTIAARTGLSISASRLSHCR